MYKSLFTLYLLLHLIGDFILQTDKITTKVEDYKHLLLQNLMYCVPFFVASVFVKYPAEWLIQATIVCAAHLVVDSIKHFIVKGKEAIGPLPYIVDQSSHLAILSVMTFLTLEYWCSVDAARWIHQMVTILEIEGMDALAWICIIVAIWKPANFTIRQVLAKYKPHTEENSIVKAGAMIGTLERIIMDLLLGMGQYGAIALVLTAKSIARYDMLKDRVFAEYYLLGTLLSTLLVLLVFIILG